MGGTNLTCRSKAYNADWWKAFDKNIEDGMHEKTAKELACIEAEDGHIFLTRGAHICARCGISIGPCRRKVVVIGSYRVEFWKQIL